ncbi:MULTISPECIES: divergent polysaccharide deacetylase family protein [Rhizobium]|uniref:divergent polysaccharide deacetylase family protein n=1 Tax=Rhizobium TaxID=379 RepID=UPI001B31B9C5|nr:MULTISPECIES: divergent polysaccharide deacetylase family protein [Rhizobium]MBX4907436.1 divergent polysaccharide deacetylase family protein [Rhizobium bangladeshense]MBX5232363.1 divergent polysaccharide deacetylase family protein [Rhizobium sp. NLR4a]MBX5249998.1 divergent polysaccharide deacetylase family protein [Rhizobium sp. NLR4b]MBX5256553.1 divergent polysaccharide deacetylase family protein [Rhizobium sp. NLR16b]MBX5262645.1 divergent polysaccharide deacetylase family protein [Rh
MGTDLHAPLGRNRKTGSRRPGVLLLGRIASLCLFAIGGFSLYTAFRGDGLERKNPPATDQAAVPSSGTPQPAQKPAGQAADGMPRAEPRSGANVEQMVTGDGSVVTKYSPRPRDGGGPVLVDAMQIGQDPRMAALPNETLLEDSAYGRLPIVGPDGRRPMDQYARPASGARGVRIAIVVSGLGLSQTGTQRAIAELPEEITLAFAASGNSLQRWMQEARRGGHEILLQVPLEPFDYPANDPGPETLLTSKPVARNIENLHKAMGEITNYTGIMNYLGGRFLSDPAAMEPVMRDIGKRGLLFLDDGTSAQSKTADVAKGTELPYVFADLQLDGQLDVNAILQKLDELERIARKNGQAIGVASAFDESVDAIAKWSEEASMRGIEIVGVAALSNDPRNP